MSEGLHKNFTVGADIGKIFRLLGTNFYSRKDLIIKELIQNANDALTLRDIDDPNFSETSGRITFESDKSLHRITIKDNGCGMTASQLEVLFETLGASAKSLATSHASTENATAREAIGSFGVGFLAVYAIADTVEIVSRSWQRHERAFHALLDGNNITVAPGEESQMPGTTIILHLNSEGEFLLENQVLDEIIKSLRQFVKFPILVDGQLIHRGRHLVTGIEADLLTRVAHVLSDAGLSFEVEPAIGGLRPDFLVHGPDGQLVVVETKNWEASSGYIARAISQAEKYKAATGADAAFVVLANAGEDRADEGVVTLHGVVSAIRGAISQPRGTQKQKAISKLDRTVFAAMPFDGTYDDVFLVAMAHAAEQIEATCVRVDQEEFSDDIVAEIHQLIRRSVVVIADLSDSRPNVLYETGYAHALGIPVAHICSTPLTDLPFDVRNWNTIAYERGQTFKLREKLAERLRAII